MIFLNGVPPIIGVGLVHVTIINILAIIFEYYYLKKRLEQKYLFLRTLTANLFSLFLGLVVMLTINNLIPGEISRLGMDSYSTEDRLAMIPSLTGLVIANIIVELPTYLIKQKLNSKTVIIQVTIANLITNLPVIAIYGSLAV